MRRRIAIIAWMLALTTLAGLGGCGTVDRVADDRTSATAASNLQPGQTTTRDVERRWGPPRTLTVFKQGHQVWHYHWPAGGMSWLSALPGADLMSTERGRPATEVVLLFSADLRLQQMLVRELPGSTGDAKSR